MKIIGISGLNNSVPYKRRAFPHLSPREYRIAQGFDAAAAMVGENGIQAAAAEERFSREKTTGAFPVNAIKYCLQQANLSIGDIDYFAHGFNYEQNRSLYERQGLSQRQFDEVYCRSAQLECLEAHFGNEDWSARFVQVPHHLAHAASAFFVSGMKEALIVVADGMGEQESTTVAVGQGDEIEIIRQIPSIHSLGILYGVFTMYLGFAFNMDEYKVMGLAPYGNPQRYFAKMMELVCLGDDGTHTIPVLFSNKTEKEKETYSGTIQILAEMFGPPRQPGTEITQCHRDVAAALQSVLQNCLLHLLRIQKRETGQSNLCMAGGVALNCTVNGIIKRSLMFRDFFVQPAAGDDGSALGAALYVQRTRQPDSTHGKMGLPLWGPRYGETAIRRVLDGRSDCSSTRYADFEELTEEVARRISEGQIIGWFQDRMEFGPRALGNRSILADPRRSDMRDRINMLVKKREGFRPFAPAVALEHASEYFVIDQGDESLFSHMLCVAPVRRAYRERLPAITHVDGSARVQTVSREGHQKFWTLLHAFEKVSGIPILLNTSFNVRGQPIVCTPTEAVETFLAAGLDALAVGSYLVQRTTHRT